MIRDKEYTYQFVILNEVEDLLFKQKQIFAVAQDDSRGSEHGIFIDANNLNAINLQR